MQPSESHVTVGAGRYRIESRIGVGGQAAVYKVFDERLQVHRAIKVLLPEYARKRFLRDRFESEAQAMANLDHPHIVRVFDVVPDADLPFIVMELIPGGSLAGWIEQNGPLPPRMAVVCTLQIASALHAAHAAGVIHRDVKPHNVLVDHRGVCKLGDFGIARADWALRTRSGSRMGTEGYMAPEQSADAAKADERSDVFSLGITLWVMLAAQDPIELFRTGGTRAIPDALRPVILRSISEHPDQRQSTIRDFARQIEAAAAQLPKDPPAVPLTQGGHHEEVDTFEEISLIVDGITQASPVTGVDDRRAMPSYVMPSLAEPHLDGNPDWIEREGDGEHTVPQVTVGVGGHPIGSLSPTPGSMSAEPRSISRAPTPTGHHPRQAEPSIVESLLDGLRDALGFRLRMLAIPVLVFMSVALVPVLWGQAKLSAARDDVVAAQKALGDAVIIEQPAIREGLLAVSADVIVFDERWVQVREATSRRARTAATLAFLDELDRLPKYYSALGTDTWAGTAERIQRLQIARQALLEANAEYQDVGSKFPGILGFGVTPAHLPALPPPGAVGGA